MHPVSQVADTVTAIAALLLVAAAILALTKKLKLPFTVILVIVGISLALLSDYFPASFGILQQVEISPDLILYVFLPTLIFESAFNLDARQLRHNLAPVLMLAVPGLLLSTFLIGFIVNWATQIPLSAALLLGAILSATDPVAVVSLFKKLGAPQRLTTLVEGESLFNDATAIVIARILITVVIAGTVSFDTVVQGAVDIFILFVGGFLVGWLLGLLTGYLLGLVESDPYIEITLTTILAYVSFLIAEELLHVSGVMATVGAGLVLGGWGRIKISPSVRTYLEHFWEYMAFVANALIFLMVGLTVELSAVWNSFDLLIWVILAMLVARAVIIYGLMPLIGKLPSAEAVSLPFKHVMFWGGLRGAIALAIVLSLPEFEYRDTFVALVMGAVVFTLVIQGLSIQSLVKWLKLNQSSTSERLVQIEVSIDGKLEAKQRVQSMAGTGVFSNKVTQRLRDECESQICSLKDQFESISKKELTAEQELNSLYLRTLAEERNKYIEMFNQGHISEGALREQTLVLTMQMDTIRYHGRFEKIHSHKLKRSIEHFIYDTLVKVPLISRVIERMKLNRIGRDYENLWAHYVASTHVLECIDHLNEIESIRPEVVNLVKGKYQKWHHQAATQLDLYAEQFPEFVAAAQERMCRRLAINAEDEHTKLQADHGTLTGSLAEEIHSDLLQRLHELRGLEVAKLIVKPESLLRQSNIFSSLPETELGKISQHLVHCVFNKGDTIIHQGDIGNSLFMLAHGVVRISHEENGKRKKVATLMSGDIFGEMALLEGQPRNASAQAITHCTLYELKRSELENILQEHPDIHEKLTLIDRRRQVRNEDTNPG